MINQLHVSRDTEFKNTYFNNDFYRFSVYSTLVHWRPNRDVCLIAEFSYNFQICFPQFSKIKRASLKDIGSMSY